MQDTGIIFSNTSIYDATNTPPLRGCPSTCTCTCTCADVHVHVHVHVHVYQCACVSMCMCINVHVHVHVVHVRMHMACRGFTEKRGGERWHTTPRGRSATASDLCAVTYPRHAATRHGTPRHQRDTTTAARQPRPPAQRAATRRDAAATSRDGGDSGDTARHPRRRRDGPRHRDPSAPRHRDPSAPRRAATHPRDAGAIDHTRPVRDMLATSCDVLLLATRATLCLTTRHARHFV
jgi:hypothetical protein